MNLPSSEEWRAMDSASQPYDPEAEAEVLEEARGRIERIRQRDVEIRLETWDGRAARGLEVEIEQLRSDFLFGEQLWQLDTLFRHGLAQADRARHFAHLFTQCLNAANCLSYWTEAPRNDAPKHMEFQGEDRLDGLEAQVNWCLAHELIPKGHPVLWSIEKAWPQWLKRYPFDTQWKFAEVRVRNLIARFRGRIRFWDLVNESLWEPVPKNLPHRLWPHLEAIEDIADFIAPVLRWAREEDPEAKFLINDYGMESDAEGNDLRDARGELVTAARQRRRMVELIQKMREEGAEPDGIGMQAHTGAWMRPSEQLRALNELAEAQVPLHYTEFWACGRKLLAAGMDAATVENLREAYTVNVLTVAFSHPAVSSFFFWGDIVQSFNFLPDPNGGGLPTSANSPTRHYLRIQKLLREEWMTRTKLMADEHGRVKFRGFYGDYTLRYKNRSGMTCGEKFPVTSLSAGPLHLKLRNDAAIPS